MEPYFSQIWVSRYSLGFLILYLSVQNVFTMVPDDFDGIISEEERQKLQQMQENTGLHMEDAQPGDVDRGYKDLTGRDLNPDMSGNDMGDTTMSAPISEEVGRKAQEAAAPIKNDVTVEQSAQRNNAFTRLDDPAPPQEPEKDKVQETPAADTPQTKRDNAFTQLGDATTQETPQPAPEQDRDR